MAISNLRWGAASSAVNSGGTGSPLALTAAFPTAGNAPIDGDLLVVVVRTWRSATTSYPSTPSTSTGGWSSKDNEQLGNANTSPTGPLTNAMRHRIWTVIYDSATTIAPVINYSASTTTDYMTVQMLCMTGADSTLDQIGTWTAAAANSSTVIGPAPALGVDVKAGGAILVLLDHERALSSGTVPNISGDGLTWTQGAQSGTAGSFAWANCSAPVASQTTVTAKQATISTTSGRGSGQMIAFRQADLVTPSHSYGLSVPARRASVI